MSLRNNSTGSSRAGESPNQFIRNLHVETLLAHGVYLEAAKSVALAIHPWPDAVCCETTLSQISAELLARRNINHFSIFEIAADRLLRIGDALQAREQNELANTFFDAANEIINAPNPVEPPSLKELVENPNGVDSGKIWTHVEEIAAEKMVLDPNGLQNTIAQMFGAAETRGVFDLGELFGGGESGISIDQLAEALDVENPLVVFDRFVDELDSRMRDIFISRVCNMAELDTLEVIADRWNVTRERIRQTETKVIERAEKEVGELFRRLGTPFLFEYRGKILYKKFVDVALMSLTSGARCHQAAAGFAARSTGPWKSVDEWSYRVDLADQVNNIGKAFKTLCDQYEVVDTESLENLFGDLFLNRRQMEHFLEQQHGLAFANGYWFKNTLRARVVAALKHLGQPSTKEKVAELMNHPVTRVGSLLSTIEGIVRADRFRWGFSEWIDDEYTGIVDEINQRIEEHDGSVSVHFLVTELPNNFGVTENSVRSYLASDAFVVEGGFVRKAGLSEYEVRDPKSVKGAVNTHDGWGQLIKLTDHPFNGYSLGVSFDLAFANGIRPHDDLLVNVAGTKHQGTIIWRPTSTNRRVDIGRVAKALEDLGFVPGDTIFAIPLPDRIVLSKSDNEEDAVDVDEEDELIFGDEDDHALLSDVIPKRKEL